MPILLYIYLFEIGHTNVDCVLQTKSSKTATSPKGKLAKQVATATTEQ